MSLPVRSTQNRDIHLLGNKSIPLDVLKTIFSGEPIDHTQALYGLETMKQQCRRGQAFHWKDITILLCAADFDTQVHYIEYFVLNKFLIRANWQAARLHPSHVIEPPVTPDVLVARVLLADGYEWEWVRRQLIRLFPDSPPLSPHSGSLSPPIHC